MQEKLKSLSINMDKTILYVIENYINNIFNKRIKEQTSLCIRHEELELLFITIRNNHPIIYNDYKTKEGENFFFNLILNLRQLLEDKIKRLLFITIRNGNYTIIDSWQASKQDWEIESKNRKKEFIFLEKEYFNAKENVPGIKTVEDFMALIKAVKLEELEQLFSFSNKTTLKKLKRLEKHYLTL